MTSNCICESFDRSLDVPRDKSTRKILKSISNSRQFTIIFDESIIFYDIYRKMQAREGELVVKIEKATVELTYGFIREGLLGQ